MTTISMFDQAYMTTKQEKKNLSVHVTLRSRMYNLKKFCAAKKKYEKQISCRISTFHWCHFDSISMRMYL